MNYEDFKKEIDEAIRTKPKTWRDGQAVFNYIDDNYGIARDVQYKDNVDCFYDDKRIESFTRLAFNRIKENEHYGK